MTISTSSLVTSSQSISYAVYTRLGMQSSVKLSIPQRQLSLMLDHVPHLVNGQDRLGDEAVAGAVGEGLRSRGQYSFIESFRQG